MKINVAILGANGYAGASCAMLCLGHPNINLKIITSRKYEGVPISEVYPAFRGRTNLKFSEIDIEKITKECDLVFTALPHGASSDIVSKLYDLGATVIDLSGDFRYNDVDTYKIWYGVDHPRADLLEHSVYGLPELHLEKIKKAKLIGNPGCYTTTSILSVAPLVKSNIIDNTSIIIDAKSGTSGAGRSVSLPLIFCEVNENIKAYKIAEHRHTSEIEQELSLLANQDIIVNFTPHLIPMQRGILTTSYCNLNSDYTYEEIIDIYKEFYKDAEFVNIYDDGKLPETKHVAGTNNINIGLKIDKRTKRVIVVAVLDNIIKGASGQAIQNANIVFGLDQDTGLNSSVLYL